MTVVGATVVALVSAGASAGGAAVTLNVIEPDTG